MLLLNINYFKIGLMYSFGMLQVATYNIRVTRFSILFALIVIVVRKAKQPQTVTVFLELLKFD